MHNRSLLTYCVYQNSSVSTIEFLIKNGADVNFVYDDDSILSTAILIGRDAVVGILIINMLAFALLNPCSSNEFLVKKTERILIPKTMIYFLYCVTQYHTDFLENVIRLLIDYGPNVSSKNNSGNTVPHHAFTLW